MLSTLDPNSELLPRSIYDVLTQISNCFQWSLCRVSSVDKPRQDKCHVRCRHGVSLILFRRRFPLVFYICKPDVNNVNLMHVFLQTGLLPVTVTCVKQLFRLLV